MKIFGLIGKNIGYSFSRNYFEKKFLEEDIKNSRYINYDIEQINKILEVFKSKNAGYNVTIPYKEAIIPFLDKINPEAKEIGAVNTIKVHDNGQLEGYNTDYYGFTESLKPYLKSFHTHALILGTGGASKAVAYALKKLNIKYIFVSRNPKKGEISYTSLNKTHFEIATIIINTTPVGTFPNIDKMPDIPYHYFKEQHIAYDLIYNPGETLFLKNAKSNNAVTINGLEMLILQAEKAWEIWNK